MLRLELIEIDPLDGGVGYGGDYGGSGSLVLNEYIAPQAKAKTGELWMSFLNDPSKKPFKVQDVASGQKVQVPSLPDAPVRFYLISNDPSGRKTVVNLNAARVRDLNVNKENKTPVIEQIGASTLDKIQIGIKNYLETARFRRIQISTTANFAPGTFVDYAIKDFDGIVKVIGALETIARPFSTVEATRWVRVAHSTTGGNYGPWSNVLGITYRNESENGVPVLRLGPPKISLLSGNWIFEFYPPLKNGYSARNLQFRLIHINNRKYSPGNVAANQTTITLNDELGLTTLSNLPPSGKMWIFGETISYASIGGPANNELQAVGRGLEKSVPTAWNAGQAFYPIFLQKDMGPTLIHTMPQHTDDFFLEYRWQNEYRDGGSDGWSQWSTGDVAFGSGSTAGTPDAPPPPPAVDPPPPAGYEDPYNPINDKRRKDDLLVQLSI